MFQENFIHYYNYSRFSQLTLFIGFALCSSEVVIASMNSTHGDHSVVRHTALPNSDDGLLSANYFTILIVCIILAVVLCAVVAIYCTYRQCSNCTTRGIFEEQSAIDLFYTKPRCPVILHEELVVQKSINIQKLNYPIILESDLPVLDTETSVDHCHVPVSFLVTNSSSNICSSTKWNSTVET